MNNREIHELGPEKITELVEAYDELYENLVQIPIQAWESENLYKKLSKNGSLERMREMIDVYRYVYDVEKCLRIEMWLDILLCTGTLLQAKEILEV